MAIKVVLAKAHEGQLSDPEIRREFESIREAYKDTELKYRDGTVDLVFVKGMYVHAERKMITACLLVNKMADTIKELHGILRLKFRNSDAVIAKAIVNFNEEFMGELHTDEALLVHFGIPVKGLSEDAEFTVRDIVGTFDEIRVTFNEQ